MRTTGPPPALAALALLVFVNAACSSGVGPDDGGTTDAIPTDAHDAADRADGDGAVDKPDGPPGPLCQLLAMTCIKKQACYPYPFEALNPNEARCAPEGNRAAGSTCQSQLDCDGKSICVSPGQPNAACLAKCNTALANCPSGQSCHGLMSYPGVGVCTQP